MTRTQPVANDRLVSEEGVLHLGLLVVARFLAPLATPDLLYSPDGTIAIAGSPRSLCCPSWRNDDFRIPRFCGVVDRDRVVGGVGCEAHDVILNRGEEIESSIRIVRVPIGQELGDDHARSIDAQMKFLPRAFRCLRA